jgi:hypothetical protein
MVLVRLAPSQGLWPGKRGGVLGRSGMPERAMTQLPHGLKRIRLDPARCGSMRLGPGLVTGAASA